MDPVFFYLVGGLAAGVAGSFVAARLMAVDRLWALPGKPPPRSLVRPLVQAAAIYNATGPSGLVAVAASNDHPLIAAALCQIIQGRSAEQLRSSLTARLNAMHRSDQQCQFAGRLLAKFAPVLGITGMAGAMYLALSQLRESGGSVAGLAVAVMLLMVGGNLIAMFSRKLSRGAPNATAAGQIGGSMVIEAAAMIRSGATPQAVEHRLLVILGDELAGTVVSQAA